MKGMAVVIAVISAVLVACCFSSGWEITYTFPAPAPNARGIARDAPYDVSVLCDGTPPRIYDLFTPSNYINLAVPSGVWGLSYWSGYGDVVVSNYNNGYIYGLTSSGSVVASFHCPKDHPADLSEYGRVWGYRYVAFPDDNIALELTTTGSIISSFSGPGSSLTAIEANGEKDAVLGDPATGKVYFVYVVNWGSANIAEPVGLCSSRRTGSPPFIDPMVVDASTNNIYSLDWVGPEPIDPSSIGRVKALFR
jgi:hypothetical protein